MSYHPSERLRHRERAPLFTPRPPALPEGAGMFLIAALTLLIAALGSGLLMRAVDSVKYHHLTCYDVHGQVTLIDHPSFGDGPGWKECRR
jgi:hypothetical protein